jgi:hypothetical protein
MKESSEQDAWVVVVLLAIAAIIGATLMPRLINVPVHRWLIVILFMALLLICGVVALRYKWRD